MNRNWVLGITALPLCACVDSISVEPNVVFILADDLGYGDLSFLGQSKFFTPNIDRLASEGKFFTQHYAGAPVSAPSRSCLVTGLHTGHTPIRGNKELPDEGQYPLPGNCYTIFDLFKARGYETGVFGKWGLGGPGTEGAPNAQGVNEFFGYNCQRLAHNYYPHHLWHNEEKILLDGNIGNEEKEYSAYLIHEAAKSFIRENCDRPFFLWYTTTLPHAELKLPQEEIEPFLEQPILQPECSYTGCDNGDSYRNGGYGSQSTTHAAFVAMVTLLDRQVGEISSLLDELGIADNTILIFTSDNGTHAEGGADPRFFDSNGPFRGIKRDLYEGGIHTPFIVKWPGVVEPGSRTDHISTFWDFMPTVAEILHVEMPANVDGLSYLPTLMGRGVQKTHDYLYWEFHEQGGRQAIRRGKWKAIRYDLEKNGQIQLYDLSQDPEEKFNLSDLYPDLTNEFDSLMRISRTESDVFPFAL